MVCTAGAKQMIITVAQAGGCRQRQSRITSSASEKAIGAAIFPPWPLITLTTASATTADRNCPAITFQEREAVMPGVVNMIAIDAASGAMNSGWSARATDSVLM